MPIISLIKLISCIIGVIWMIGVYKTLKDQYFLKRKSAQRNISSQNNKMNRFLKCFRCNSDRILKGKTGDGYTANIYSPCFSPSNIRFWNMSYVTWLAADSQAECCTDCGLVWLTMNPEELKEFIINKCKDDLTEKLYKSNYNDNRNQRIDSASEIKTYCKNCSSEKILSGKLLLRRTILIRTKTSSLFFHPCDVKWYKFRLRRGIKINSKAVCCTECGFIFSELNYMKLEKFILKNCKEISK